MSETLAKAIMRSKTPEHFVSGFLTRIINHGSIPNSRGYYSGIQKPEKGAQKVPKRPRTFKTPSTFAYRNFLLFVSYKPQENTQSQYKGKRTTFLVALEKRSEDPEGSAFLDINGLRIPVSPQDLQAAADIYHRRDAKNVKGFKQFQIHESMLNHWRPHEIKVSFQDREEIGYEIPWDMANKIINMHDQAKMLAAYPMVLSALRDGKRWADVAAMFKATYARLTPYQAFLQRNIYSKGFLKYLAGAKTEREILGLIEKRTSLRGATAVRNAKELAALLSDSENLRAAQKISRDLDRTFEEVESQL